MKLTMKDNQLSSSSRAGLGMAILGLPFAALGLLMIGAALREITIALLGGVYIETPGTIGAHLFRIGISVVFFGLGLLMVFGGTYLRIDMRERQIMVRNFYGLFARTVRFTFSDVTQVLLRCERTNRSFQSRSMNDSGGSHRTPRTVYKVELVLSDGRRPLLGSSYDKEATQASGQQLAELFGVQLLDIGLVGSLLRRTSA